MVLGYVFSLNRVAGLLAFVIPCAAWLVYAMADRQKPGVVKPFRIISVLFFVIFALDGALVFVIDSVAFLMHVQGYDVSLGDLPCVAMFLVASAGGLYRVVCGPYRVWPVAVSMCVLSVLAVLCHALPLV